MLKRPKSLGERKKAAFDAASVTTYADADDAAARDSGNDWQARAAAKSFAPPPPVPLIDSEPPTTTLNPSSEWTRYVGSAHRQLDEQPAIWAHERLNLQQLYAPPEGARDCCVDADPIGFAYELAALQAEEAALLVSVLVLLVLLALTRCCWCWCWCR